MTSSASILTITAFTVERYVAICYPLRAQTMSSLPRALRTIAGVWVAACATALPYPIYTRTYHYLSDPRTGRPLADSLICNIPADRLPEMRVVFQLSTFLLFALPMTVITVLYVLIGVTIRRSTAANGGSNGGGGVGGRRTGNSLPLTSSPRTSGAAQSGRKAVLKMLGT